MKVAIIVWELSQLGGIATHAVETKKILTKSNIDSDIIILTNKDRAFKIDKQEIETTEKLLKIKGIELSVKKKNLKMTLNFLNNYDILFHTTACLHKDNGWLAVYKFIKKRHIVVISDVYWNDFYRHFDKAMKYVYKFYATNEAVRKYLKKEKGINTELVIHPFSFNEYYNEHKENIVIWAHQWRGWKGIKRFVENADRINGKVVMFGGGREYYNLKDKLPKNVEYKGFRSPNEIKDMYKKAKIAVDFTGQSEKYYGHYNRATIEPMFFKCIMVCNEKLVYPYSFIPREVVCPVDKDNFIDKINRLLENNEEREYLANKAYNWATKKYNFKNVIKQIIHQ